MNTHGVAGEVKIEVWLDSPKFFRSFKRIYLGEREVKVVSARTHKDFVIAKLEGIDDIHGELEKAVDRMNKTAKAAHIISEVRVRTEPLEKTGSGKIKRKATVL